MTEYSSRDKEIILKILHKMLRKDVVGSHHLPIDAVKRWAVASHNEKEAEHLIRELATDPTAPVQQVKGKDNVQLTSIQAGKEYVKQLGGEPPFWV
ncbi:MAG: hypothetical protein ABEK59_06670 [Halobacteria archaeon]